MQYNHENLIPGQSVDCVIIGFAEGELKVLVLKWKGMEYWTLPGGFVQNEEDLDAAAIRVLQLRTGIKLPFLEQLYTFGHANRRNQDFENSHLVENLISNESDFVNWVKQRFISTAYISLVEMDKCNIVTDSLSESCEWIAVSELPELVFDHQSMVDKALERIRIQLNYLPIGMNLLPVKFAMRDLQELYESILQKKLDRGNFQKKMLKLNILIRLEKQMNGGAHKAPYLYTFDEVKYNKSLANGIGFIS